MRVGIVDYGLGNLRSVAGAVERLGHEPVVTSDPEQLARVEKLLLPGVGAFGDGMRNLRERGLVEPLNELVLRRRVPVLGLCLGAQLIARRSEEFGDHEGLGWIDSDVCRIPANGVRVPHVGWNELHRTGECLLFEGLDEQPLFYFVHSFYLQPDDPAVVKAECVYGVRMPAVIQKDNIYGTQFHPEKSQLAGLTLLGNFLERT